MNLDPSRLLVLVLSLWKLYLCLVSKIYIFAFVIKAFTYIVAVPSIILLLVTFEAIFDMLVSQLLQ